MNALDRQLYDWAADRFAAAIASSPGFDEELHRFRRRNRRYQPIGKLTHSVPKRIEVQRWFGRVREADPAGSALARPRSPRDSRTRARPGRPRGCIAPATAGGLRRRAAPMSRSSRSDATALGPRALVLGRHEEPAARRAPRIGQRADVARDHWHARGVGLHDRPRGRFVPSRRHEQRPRAGAASPGMRSGSTCPRNRTRPPGGDLARKASSSGPDPTMSSAAPEGVRSQARSSGVEPLLRSQSAEEEEPFARARSPLLGRDEVGLHQDPLPVEPGLHVLALDEFSDGQEAGDRVEAPGRPMQLERGREDRAGASGLPVTGVSDAWQCGGAQAVLADTSVAQERRWQAHQSVVVQGHHDRGACVAGRGQDGGREGREHVVHVHHVDRAIRARRRGPGGRPVAT